MDKVINMNEFIGATAGDQQHMLGKFLYYSLANLLVDKDELLSQELQVRSNSIRNQRFRQRAA